MCCKVSARTFEWFQLSNFLPLHIITENFPNRNKCGLFCCLQIITTTIHQLLGPALDYAKGHAADRTAEALAALADPEETPFVLSVAAGMSHL